MRKRKYIITEKDDIIIFSECIRHDAFLHLKPKSAGFVQFFVDDEGKVGVNCYGESISLKLKSLPGDNEIAERLLLNDGFF